MDIRERILSTARFVSKSEFTRSTSKVLTNCKRLQRYSLPFLFRYPDCNCIKCFPESYKVEWLVLETGLGGMADSTNVTNKELCILTKIGLDHQDVLGNDLKQIASEKIGISRKGIPMIVAPQVEELNPWLTEKLSKVQVYLVFLSMIFLQESFLI